MFIDTRDGNLSGSHHVSRSRGVRVAGFGFLFSLFWPLLSYNKLDIWECGDIAKRKSDKARNTTSQVIRLIGVNEVCYLVISS